MTCGRKTAENIPQMILLNFSSKMEARKAKNKGNGRVAQGNNADWNGKLKRTD